MASGLERPCIAMNPDGSVAKRYLTIKDIAWDFDMPITSMRTCLTKGKKIGNYKVMFEDVYDEVAENGSLSKYTWKEPSKRFWNRESSTDTITMEIASGNIIAAFFKQFSKLHIEWLREVLEKWSITRMNNVFPWDIADYYDDKKDKEVALFASLSLDIGYDCHAKIWGLMDEIGKYPWEWFRNRMFDDLGYNSKSKDSKLARLMDSLWCEGISNGEIGSIREYLEGLPYFHDENYCDVIELLFDRNRVSRFDGKASLAVLTLSTDPYLGKGVWDVGEECLRAPETKEMKGFLEKWFPDWRKCGDMDKALGFFGVGIGGFVCMNLAYNQLSTRFPNECRVYEKRYRVWYTERAKRNSSKWKEILPVKISDL